MLNTMIHQAAIASQVVSHADVEFLHNIGFNLAPLIPGSKRASGRWAEFQDAPQTESDLLSLDWTGGVAGINGVNGIRSLDFDGAGWEPVEYLLQMLGLGKGYQWVVKSGSGYHIWFKCFEEADLRGTGTTDNKYVGKPSNKKYQFTQLELRWNHHYTVLPPSIHPDTNRPYEWVHGKPNEEMRVLSRSIVRYAFNCIAELKVSSVPAEPKTVADTSTTYTGSSEARSKWAMRALELEVGNVRNAEEGNRNNTLFQAAARLGEIIAGGSLEEDSVVALLTEAAETIGLSGFEIDNTIHSGLRSGSRNPREPKELAPLNVEDVELLKHAPDDGGNADAVVALFGNQILYNGTYGWMVYNGMFWEADREHTIDKFVEQTLRRRRLATIQLGRRDEEMVRATSASANHLAGCKRYLSSKVFADITTFDSNPDVLNARNGVIDLRTGTLIPHSPTQRFTYCVPVDYEPETNNAEFVEFLKDVIECGDNLDAMIEYIQQAIGYSLSGRTSEEKMWYVYGPPRSGKGTFTEALLELLPRPLGNEVDFNTFTRKRDDDQNFDLSPLKPSRLVFASESNKYQTLNPAKIKAMTGGNMVQAAFKHKDMFTFRPQWKIWLVSNHPINGDPDDDALWSRLQVVVFPHSHVGSEDVMLKARMKSPEVLQGLLVWAVQGAMKWYERKQLIIPTAVKDQTRKQREALDTVQMWLDECCEVGDKTDFATNGSIMSSYLSWCRNQGITYTKSSTALTASLKEKKFRAGEAKKIDGKTARGCYGLRVVIS